MTTLAEVEQTYVAAKLAYKADPTEENLREYEEWAALLTDARQKVRDYLPFEKGSTAKQRHTIKLEHLGWKP